ncbi:hypothetical protein HYG86_14240 [Alkalicella caledoniensis]|uniref:Tocopherol cyclase n=2 Tax=Alkalicella caledoniensis TaxID=2731377 RepID=A0A7G9WDF0_ALKCA|nr:hypothetical protein HYG86_14240 [Alkalicella caledoniensis]
MGRSSFTEREAKINLVNENILIEGHLTYGNFSKINTSIINPNIMGCFAYIPKMECNHGVISMDHSVNGRLKYGNTHLEFLNDRGYIEKDWGSSFPEQYIWIQANNFEKQGDSFMCSIAKIPMLGVKFNGLIANLHHNGKEYRFATYNNSKILEISHNKDGVSLKLSKKDIKLFIHAIFDTKGSLKAPTKGTMSNTIKEGLGGKISLTLTQKGKTMAEITSPYAGIEIVGYGTEVTDRKLKI